MKRGRAALSSAIAVALTLLALVVAGIWVWRAALGGATSRGRERLRAAPPEAPAGGESFSAAERRGLEDALRRKHPRREDAEATQ